MLNYSMIQLLRRKGKKVDKELRREIFNFYRPFRAVPCFLHRLLEKIRKRTRKLPILIEYNDRNFMMGSSELKKVKCHNLKEHPSISCYSAKLCIKDIEYLLDKSPHITKTPHDRNVTPSLDTATPSIHADQLQDNGLTGQHKPTALIDTGNRRHEDLSLRITG